MVWFWLVLDCIFSVEVVCMNDSFVVATFSFLFLTRLLTFLQTRKDFVVKMLQLVCLPHQCGLSVMYACFM